MKEPLRLSVETSAEEPDRFSAGDATCFHPGFVCVRRPWCFLNRRPHLAFRHAARGAPALGDGLAC